MGKGDPTRLDSVRRHSSLRRRSSLLLRRGSHHHCPMDSSKTLQQDYLLLHQIGRGRFGRRLLLAEDAGLRVLLRVFNRTQVPKADFLREYNYSVFLAPHPNVLETYEGMLTAGDDWWFVQEWTPRGSVRDLLEAAPGPLPESAVKHIARQVMSGLEFLHSEGLVWRDLCADNLLLFPSQQGPSSSSVGCSSSSGELGVDRGAEEVEALRVKLSDFRQTRKAGTRATHASESLGPFHAPELCECLEKEAYVVEPSGDIWALGILVFLLCRGRFPWPRAAITAKAFMDWKEWRKGNTHAPPKLFAARFTDKALRLLKKTLAIKPKDRPALKDLHKYLGHRWLKEVKSMSDEDLGPAGSGKGRRSARLSRSNPSSPTSESPPDSKKKSILHQWFASTLNTMSEISEQMVSAED